MDLTIIDNTMKAGIYKKEKNMEYTWEKQFLPQIRNRGRLYFQNGRVKNMQVKPGQEMISATVIGRENYDVSVHFSGNRISEMYCDCPYAQSGGQCKHQAALLYAIEAEKKKSDGLQKSKTISQGRDNARYLSKEPVELFSEQEENGNSEYRFYQMGEVANSF